MTQVEALEQQVSELDDISFSKFRNWFVEFERTRKAETKASEIPQWQKDELDKRLLEHETTVEEHTPYQEFHAQLRSST